MLGLRCCVLPFSSCSQWGLPSSCDAWASHHQSFSHGAWDSGARAQQLWLVGLVAPQACEVFLAMDLNRCPPVLQGGVLITGPPGKPEVQRFTCKVEHPNTSLISAIYGSYKCPFIEQLSYSVFLGWSIEQL